jgi:hypothetical protein
MLLSAGSQVLLRAQSAREIKDAFNAGGIPALFFRNGSGEASSLPFGLKAKLPAQFTHSATQAVPCVGFASAHLVANPKVQLGTAQINHELTPIIISFRQADLTGEFGQSP